MDNHHTSHSEDQPHEEEHVPAHHAHNHARERRREGITMALYISLSLLAVLIALPPSLNPGSAARPALTVFLTSMSLFLAHALAFRVSTRLVNQGQLSAENLELLASQFAGGLAVTAVAVLPVLIIGGPDGVRVAEFLLLAFVAVVGYFAARSVPVSRSRALLYVAGVVSFALVVLWVKSLVHY